MVTKGDMEGGSVYLKWPGMILEKKKTEYGNGCEIPKIRSLKKNVCVEFG